MGSASVALHRQLAEAGIKHAFGGAFALGFYAEPRPTADLDLNVFLPLGRWPEVAAALSPLEIEAAAPAASSGDEPSRAADAGPDRNGRWRLRWEQAPLDIFFSREAIHEEMARRIRQLPFEGSTLPVVAPEHLIVRKALLDRPKDWLDIEAILARTAELEFGEIERWLKAMAGSDDPRTARFADLKAALAG